MNRQTKKERAKQARRRQKSLQKEKERQLLHTISAEHATYVKLCHTYERFSRKRPIYIKYGLLAIFLLPVIFLIFMFSLESKIIFLVLWVLSIIGIAAFLIAVEYKDYWYKELLGLPHDRENRPATEPEEIKPAKEDRRV